MSERAQVLSLQIVGFVAVVGAIALAAWLGREYPVPMSMLSSLISLFVGKLFGESLPLVTLQQVQHMPPAVAAAVARRAIESLPPTARAQLTGAAVVLTGLSMPPSAADD